jgi:hypothetical protein
MRFTVSIAVVLVILVTFEVWPTRSRHLFSWDSANYAFAISKIDIAQHRPHPPGYLGYVFAGRLLAPLFSDVNAALIAWNVLALSAAGALMALLATPSPFSGSSIAAAALLVTSPLVWFYASVSEIYVSELLCTLAVAYAARRSLDGSARALSWCAAALAGAALFKLSAMVLMLPVAGYAWYRAPNAARRRSAVVLAVVLAGVGAVFLTIEPNLVRVLWDHFVSATSGSRLLGGAAEIDAGLAFNRNVRDTFTALLAALGFVNACGLVLWLAADRRAPGNVDRWFLALWVLPWIAELVFIHIGKPGYILPIVPALVLVLTSFYARRGIGWLIAIVALQAAANVAYIAFVIPPAAPDLSATVVRYRDKSFARRMASDLEPLTFPTRATIASSDRQIDRLLALGPACPSGEWVVVAGNASIDWRRAMYYLPAARAIDVLPDGRPEFIGLNGDSVPVPQEGAPIASDCGLLWIGDTRPASSTVEGRRVNDVGWLWPPGMGRVTRDAVSWTAR